MLYQSRRGTMRFRNIGWLAVVGVAAGTVSRCAPAEVESASSDAEGSVAVSTQALIVPSGFSVAEFQPTLPRGYGGRATAVSVNANNTVVLVASDGGGLFRCTQTAPNQCASGLRSWTHNESL